RHERVVGPLILDSRQQRVIARAGRDTAHNALSLRVPQDSVLAMPAAYAAVLDAAHGHIKAVVDEKRGIDHGGAGFDLPRNLTGPPFSASPDRSIQTKFGVICPNNEIVSPLHGGKTDDGATRIFSRS